LSVVKLVLSIYRSSLCLEEVILGLAVVTGCW
jgi:hypothetical protein